MFPEKLKNHPETPFDLKLDHLRSKINKERRYLQLSGYTLAIALATATVCIGAGADSAGFNILSVATVAAISPVYRFFNKLHKQDDLKDILDIRQEITKVGEALNSIPSTPQKLAIKLAVRHIHYSAALYGYNPFTLAEHINNRLHSLDPGELSPKDIQVTDFAQDQLKQVGVGNDNLTRALAMYDTIAASLPQISWGTDQLPESHQISQYLSQTLEELIPDPDDNMLPSRLAVDAPGTTTLNQLLDDDASDQSFLQNA